MKRRPVVAHSTAVRSSLILSALLLALPLSAQVKPVSPPVKPRPLPDAVQLPAKPDLRVSKVAIRLVDAPVPTVYADVTVENAGAAPAVFPAGSMMLYAHATWPGGLMFGKMYAPGEYVIGKGESRTLILKADPCPPGPSLPPAPPVRNYIFQVDPTNKVEEVDESNEATYVVDDYTGGDLTGAVEFRASGASSSTGEKAAPNSVAAAQPAELVVTIKNGGAGSALICGQRLLWIETQSPLEPKYRLRSVSTTAAVVIPPGQKVVSTLANAYQPGDLPPGTYPWAIRVSPNNPREANANNNSAAIQVQIH